MTNQEILNSEKNQYNLYMYLFDGCPLYYYAKGNRMRFTIDFKQYNESDRMIFLNMNINDFEKKYIGEILERENKTSI